MSEENSRYPEKALMAERELKFSEIVMMALSLFKNRIGAYLLIILMFFLPVAGVLTYVQAQMPDLSGITDVTAYATALVEAYLPILGWTVGLSFFQLLGTLTAIVITHNELYEENKIDLGTAFTRALKRFPAAASAYLVVLLSLTATTLFCSGISAMISLLSLFVLPFMMAYLVYFYLMKESTAVVAVHTGMGLWRNTGCVNMLYRGRLPRVFGIFLLLVLVTELPAVLLSLVASFGLDLVENETLALILSAGISGVLEIFSLFLSISMTVLVNNYGDIQNKKLQETNNQNSENTDNRNM